MNRRKTSDPNKRLAFALSMTMALILFGGCSPLEQISKEKPSYYSGEIQNLSEESITIAVDTEQKRKMLAGVSEENTLQKNKEPSSGQNMTFAIEEDQKTVSSKLHYLEKGDLVTILSNDGKTAASIEKEPEKNPLSWESEGQGETTSSTHPLKGALVIKEETKKLDQKTIVSDQKDQNAVVVSNQGSLTFQNGVIRKSNDTAHPKDNSAFGYNAASAVADGSTLSVNSTKIRTNGLGATGLFSTGDNTSLSVTGTTIHTKKKDSSGLRAVSSSNITAENTKITTEGDSSASLSADKGTISLTSSALSSSGKNSPCIQSSGTILARQSTGRSPLSPLAVIQGKNSITLEDCDLSGGGDYGILLYQEDSNQEETETATFYAANSTLQTSSANEMFHITNTTAEINLKNTNLQFPSGMLINCTGDTSHGWGNPGSNGGDLQFNGTSQTLTGDIFCDSISRVFLSLVEKSYYKGTINQDGIGGYVSLCLDKDSKWEVTGDSYLNVLTNDDHSFQNIISNGHTVYYDSTNPANNWLNGRNISLPGKGILKPYES